MTALLMSSTNNYRERTNVPAFFKWSLELTTNLTSALMIGLQRLDRCQCCREQQTMIYIGSSRNGSVPLASVRVDTIVRCNNLLTSRNQVIVSCNISNYFQGLTEAHECCWAARSITKFSVIFVHPFC